MKNSKLIDKASRLDFSQLPGSSPDSVTGAGAVALPTFTPRPKTAPGALMAFANDTRSELLRENEALRERARQTDVLRGRLDEALDELQQWEGAKATRLIDPTWIRPSRYANRHPHGWSGADFQKLRSEIQDAGGNVQPIKVRPVNRDEGDGCERYEVVFGHRRLQACRELGLPVLAVVDNLDDQTLFVEMERENRSRKDLSAWEQGRMYRRALDEGLFPSNRKLAEAIGVDLSALGKALALAALPDFVIEAFPSPLQLQFRWAKPLADALRRDPARVRAAARALQAAPGEHSARQVLERLIAKPSEETGQGMEPFHPLQGVSIRLGDLDVGSVRMAADGSIEIRLEPGAGGSRAQDLAALADMLSACLVDLQTSRSELSPMP
ncbi:MAG: hypothetical protein RL654_532 [Pseudomonadota bacterium]|jgi:ParB family chromosome partitioning protein